MLRARCDVSEEQVQLQTHYSRQSRGALLISKAAVRNYLRQEQGAAVLPAHGLDPPLARFDWMMLNLPCAALDCSLERAVRKRSDPNCTRKVGLDLCAAPQSLKVLNLAVCVAFRNQGALNSNSTL